MGQIVTAADLAELRQQAEAEFDDLCIVERQTGTTTDPDTFQVVPVYTAVYDDVDNPGAGAPCRFRMTTSIGINPARDRDVAEQNITITQVMLQIPVPAVGIRINDRVRPTFSLDPEIPDHLYRIDGPYPGQTHGVCRRYWLEIFS